MEPWRPYNIKLHQTLEIHQSAINNIRFTSDGYYCFSCGNDNKIVLLNPYTGLIIKDYKGGHNHGIFDFSIASDNSKICSVGSEFHACLWDITTGNVIRKFSGHTNRLECCNINHNDTILCVGSYDKKVTLWDLKSNSRNPIQILSDAFDSISGITSTDKEIITVSLDKHLRCYDLRKGKLYDNIYASPITSIDQSNDSDFAIISCLGDGIYLIDRSDNGEVICIFEGHINSKYKLRCAFSSLDELVVTGSEDNNVYIWDLSSMTISDQGNKKALSSKTKNLDRENDSNDQIIRFPPSNKLCSHGGVVTSVAFHIFIDQLMLTVSSDRCLKIWKKEAI